MKHVEDRFLVEKIKSEKIYRAKAIAAFVCMLILLILMAYAVVRQNFYL